MTVAPRSIVKPFDVLTSLSFSFDIIMCLLKRVKSNDPNKIVHFSAWTSIADTHAFFESPQLVKIRAQAGVKAPEFIYLEMLESGAL